MTHYHWQGQTLILRCHLQPKAASDGIVGIRDGRLKIRLSAPPVDGKANRYLQKWLAKQFGVAKSAVSLQKGDTSRQKTLAIIAPQQLPATAGIQWPQG